MGFGYTLGREECRRAAIGLRRLTPAWRWVVLGRGVGVAIAIAAILGAAFCAATVSWTAAACVFSLAVWGVGVRLFLSDGFYRTPPQGPIAITLGLEDGGMAVQLDGQDHLVPWDQVTRVVDADWAWFLGIGADEWLVLPVRAVESREAVAAELAARTGRAALRLP